MIEPPIFCGGMYDNTVQSFLRAVDMYFGTTSINKQTRYKFASLLLIEDAENWYNTRNYTFNAT